MSTAIPAVTSSGQPVIILKEGSSQTKGREAQKNNIMAAKIIAEIVKSSLGPRGMDKMLVDGMGDVTITNDGATILKELDIQHPAAKMMVEIAKTTDQEVGDGTTSSVILAGALLENAEDLISKEVHPTIIVDGYRKALLQALKILAKVSIKVKPSERGSLIKIAKTSMLTKLVGKESNFLSGIIVDALLQVSEKDGEGYKVDLDDVKVEKKPGRSIKDTSLIQGIVLDKEVVHSGMPNSITNGKIILLNSALEIEKPEFDAKINISDPTQMKAFMDEENSLLRGMVDKIIATGANTLICQKGIDDIAQHYLAKENILAVRRVKQSDMEKLAKATGGRITANLEEITKSDLGNAGLVEQRSIEDDKWVFVEKAKNPKAVTLLIRGGTQRIVDEAERSIHDALSVVKDVIEKPEIVAGGGAPEAYVSFELGKWSNKLSGREQLAVRKFADALEAIPVTLAENAGLDPIDIKVELKSALSRGDTQSGIGVLEGGIRNMKDLDVFEPTAVKEQIIKSATEVASMIIRIDDVIASGKSSAPPGPPGGGMGGMGDY
ncbi:MAG TPA: thermosome subunit beta [Nitrososphaerales archaeon]|jgi:thermosome|nr:thermosome subunit beta [Nitrososphaerales archaeon]